MKFRVFTYPVSGEERVEELNAFLSSRRIVNVCRRV